MLTTILFLHCTLHPDVSYRQVRPFRARCASRARSRPSRLIADPAWLAPFPQGMHELAAAMLLAVELDSLPPLADAQDASPQRATLHHTLSRPHVEHDAYTLFSALMRNGAQAFYAHHPEPDAPKGSRGTASAIAGEAKQPIIRVCDAMWDLLGRIDPALKAKLDGEGIEPQLFGMCVLSSCLAGRC